MTQNLNVDKFRNGDPIPQVTSDEEWDEFGDQGKPAWCYYNNDPANGEICGKLYNWHAVNDPRGLAPDGWKIPSDEDWRLLIDSLSGENTEEILFGGVNGWNYDDLTGGYRDFDFSNFGRTGYWWSINESTGKSSINYALNCMLLDGNFKRDFRQKKEGFSVRCLRDELSGNKPLSVSTIEKLEYPQVKIDNQLWMSINLDVSTFRNGDPIPHITSDEEWEEYGEKGKPAWCYSDNDILNGEKYGKLYNWHAVNDPRGLAPEGWHVPSYKEWIELVDYLGGENKAGAIMKAESGWSDNGNGNNELGFSGLPGGLCLPSGGTAQFGSFGYFWSSTEINKDDAWYCFLYYFNAVASLDNEFVKSSGLSVRCVKD